MTELDQNEARERVEVAFQLAELTKHPGWNILREFVQSRAAAKQNRLLSGNVVTIEDYKKEAGWLAGANDVLRAPQAADELAREAREVLKAGGDAA